MKQFAIIVVICLLVSNISAFKFFKLHIEDHEMEYDNQMTEIDVKLTKNKDGDTKINVKAELFDEIEDDLIVHVRHFSLENGIYEPYYVNISVDACKFMKKMKSHPLVRLIMAELGKSTNIPTHCPIKKGSYFLRDFVFNSDFLPPYLQEKTFKADILINRLVDDQEVMLVHSIWYVRLEATAANPLKLLKSY